MSELRARAAVAEAEAAMVKESLAAAEAARRESDAAALAGEHRGAALAAQLAEAERRVAALDQECEEGQVS